MNEFIELHKGFEYAFTFAKMGGWEVLKFKDNELIESYFISEESGCSCPGFKYHGRCWHFDKVRSIGFPNRKEFEKELWLKALAIAELNKWKDLIQFYRGVLRKKFDCAY